jgi:large subunit ribosomal protein L20
MTRVKRGVETKRKHKKLLEQAKGFWMTRSRHVRSAKQAVLHAGEYAFAGRKNRKRDFRALWILRISEACKKAGISYSVFINKLHTKKIELDRKVLAWLIVNDEKAFTAVVDKVK